MSRAIAVPPARLLPVFVALLLATAAFVSIAAPTAAAAKPCWERVIDDWIDNGRIDGYFSPACLRSALQHVPEDIRAYSDFEEKIRQGIQAALRVRVLEGRTGDDAASAAERSQVDRLRENETDAAGAGNAEGPLQRALGYRNDDASSIPLPLIILAALALVLMAAGAAGVTHRKLQARRARSD